MKTPWNWDNFILEWFKTKVLKRPSERTVISGQTKKEIYDLVDEVKDNPKTTL
jgi:hypothetical protein